MWVAFANANAKATHIFSGVYVIFNDEKFTITLINDIDTGSFEQLGPGRYAQSV